MLRILESRRTLRFTRGGRLLPWLGPALRGLIAWRMKERVCRHHPEDRDHLWIHCKGCPFNRDCAYGTIFEPDPPEETRVFVGQEDAIRPLVIAPHFPAPPQAQAGCLYPLRVVFIGAQAAQHAQAFWEAVAQAGGQSGNGLGTDGVQFQVLERPSRDHWHQVELPLCCDRRGPGIARLEVRLTSPLFLRDSNAPGGRRTLGCPDFSDLFRAALRCLGRLYALYDQPLDADFAGLKQAAQEVMTEQAEFVPFSQTQTSARRHQRGRLHGIIGRAIYRDVPEALATWMHWAGRLHVGLHRVAGAGGWVVLSKPLEHIEPTPSRVCRLLSRPRRRPPYRHRLH